MSHSAIETLQILMAADRPILARDLGKQHQHWINNNTAIKNICLIREMFGKEIILGKDDTNGEELYWYNRLYNGTPQIIDHDIGYEAQKQIIGIVKQGKPVTRRQSDRPCLAKMKDGKLCQCHHITSGKCVICGELRD